jgi:hypothetical protein
VAWHSFVPDGIGEESRSETKEKFQRRLGISVFVVRKHQDAENTPPPEKNRTLR